MTRYQIVELRRKKKGFTAVVVDNQHPSGVAGIPIKWFPTTADAVRHLGNIPHTIIKEKVR